MSSSEAIINAVVTRPWTYSRARSFMLILQCGHAGNSWLEGRIFPLRVFSEFHH